MSKHNIVLSNKKYNTVGTRPLRPDGSDKVTGIARYGADIFPTNYIHGKILRSPHAHAEIKSIDFSKAEKLPGVLGIVTNKDFPISKNKSEKYLRNNSLADNKVLYVGHAIAGVAAINPHIAEEAIDLIDVKYEVLPPVLTAPDGASVDSPKLHKDLRTDMFGEQQEGETNIASKFKHAIGNLKKGFDSADIVIEKEFNTATVHQGYIEPMNVTAHWNNDSRIHIWLSTQGPFQVREVTATALGLRTSQIKVTPLEIGGGFGGKFPLYQEPVACLLSKKTGKPVKIIMSRKEVFEGTGPTSGSRVWCKIGSTKDGKIVAAEGFLSYEAGAYPGSPVEAGGKCMFASYDIENVSIEGIDVVVNKPKVAAYRAPGATNATFATETIIDEIANKLKIDPIEFRLMNASKEGTRRADGPKFPKIGAIDLLDAMKNHDHWKSPLKGENVGRGVAIGFWFNGGNRSTCTIGVNPDGTIILVEGSPDIGGSRASIAMQAAEILHLNYNDVYPSVADTDSIGYSDGTGGSRTTFATGWAAIEAAKDVLDQMISRTAKIWGIESKNIEYINSEFISKTDPELKMTFKELASRLADSGGPITGKGTVSPTGVGGSFCGNIVDVKVDTDTGKVDILRFTAFQDAGKAIHPSYVEGQIQGGSAQGIGWALNEEYFYDDTGDLKNSSFLDYRMPTSLDLPMIDTVIIENANPGHPFGVRGVGEANIVPPPAAIANAIFNSADVRMDVLPMSPMAVLDSIKQNI